MTIQEVIRYFGSGAEVSRRLGYTRQAITMWKIRGVVPLHVQHRLQRMTSGKLKVNFEDDQ